jgi:hypothetical protein
LPLESWLLSQLALFCSNHPPVGAAANAAI